MGEIADALIDGEFDYETGEYLGEPVGYPRRAKDMRDDFEYTPEDALFGIKNYLKKKKLDQQLKDILKCYAIEHQWQEVKEKDIAIKIQENFGAFVKWINKLY